MIFVNPSSQSGETLAQTEVNYCLSCRLTVSPSDAYWHWKSGHSTSVSVVWTTAKAS